MLSAILKYFTRTNKKDQLPRLRKTLVSRFNIEDIDPELQRVMRTGIVRDPHAAQELLDEYNVTTADELFKVMPKRKVRPNYRQRFLNYIAMFEGGYRSDPNKADQRKVSDNRL